MRNCLFFILCFPTHDETGEQPFLYIEGERESMRVVTLERSGLY